MLEQLVSVGLLLLNNNYILAEQFKSHRIELQTNRCQMALKFRGEFAALKEVLSPIIAKDAWIELSENHKQFRHSNGAIVNWYPSTGTINLQGKESAAKELEGSISMIIAGGVTTSKAKEVEATPITKVQTEKASNDQAEDVDLVSEKLLGHRFDETEIVIGIVSTVGTEYNTVVDYLTERLRLHGYSTALIHVSSAVIKQLMPQQQKPENEYDRINLFMDLGNKIRANSEDNSILALGVASEIFKDRERDEKNGVKPQKKKAYIVNSLKHPEEAERLKEIYEDGFYLIGIAADENKRIDYLKQEKRMTDEQSEELIRRDRDELEGYGQHTRDTFQLSDFFINLDDNRERIKGDIRRILDILFGNPYVTPTFDEFAMFLAFASALRSADLSRQVGAVIAKGKEIIATGANDCPTKGGGLYWPCLDNDKHEISDKPNGRDYKLGYDSNKEEQRKIVNNILDKIPEDIDKEKVREALGKSYLKDITEYGRIVHAEMEALMFCSRNNIAARGADLYCTTFPCHNCAKHIIAAGIERVIYVEPYPKSKAFEFYSDAITSEKDDLSKVRFLPFVGVGPRKFFDFFSVNLSVGSPIHRKDDDGLTVGWRPEGSKARIQMLPCSYLEKETLATAMFNQYREKKNEES